MMTERSDSRSVIASDPPMLTTKTPKRVSSSLGTKSNVPNSLVFPWIKRRRTEGSLAMMRSFIFLLLLQVTLDCSSAAPLPRDAPTDGADAGTESADAGEACARATSEQMCRAKEGCGWADRGAGPECLYYGTIVPEPGSPDPSGGGRLSGETASTESCFMVPPSRTILSPAAMAMLLVSLVRCFRRRLR